MAVRIAGSDRYRQRASIRRRRFFVIGGVVIVVAIVIVAWQMGVFSMFSKKKPVVAVQPPVTSSARQAEDVDLVAGAVGQYSATNSTLPTGLSTVANNGLVLCGSTCDPTNNEVSGFVYYQASGFKIVSYAAGLTAPSQSVVYLVPGAKCGDKGQVSVVNTDPRSMVLLYDNASTSGAPDPRCIVL